MLIKNIIKKWKPNKHGYRVLIKCLNCGSLKEYPFSIISAGKGKYCSRKCLDMHRRGKHNTYRNGITFKDGYVFIFSPEHPFKDSKGYVREHRLIVEKKLNRFLKKDEVIHHINEIKNDNRLSNLYLFNNLSQHKTYHLLLRSGRIDRIIESNIC